MSKTRVEKNIEDGESRGWYIVIYEQHIGIVNGNGESVASVVGKRGNKRMWENANLIVKAVNKYLRENK